MQNFDALPFHSVTIENTPARLAESAASGLRAVADGLADAARAGHPAQVGRLEVCRPSAHDRWLYDLALVSGENARRVCLALDFDPCAIRRAVAQACADLHAQAAIDAHKALMEAIRA